MISTSALCSFLILASLYSLKAIMYVCLQNLTLSLDIMSFSSLLQILFNFFLFCLYQHLLPEFCLHCIFVLVVEVCKRMDKPNISLGNKYWLKVITRLNIAAHEIKQLRDSKLKHFAKFFSLIPSEESTEPDHLLDRCLICKSFWVKLCGTWTV